MHPAGSIAARLDAAAAVLAGGRSTRFGRDKALLPVGGQPLLARLCRELVRQFPSVAVVAKAPETYAAILPAGVARVPDTSTNKSPLVGLASALNWAPCDSVFVLACDMPWGATHAVASALFAALGAADAAAFTWRDQPEPLCAFYRRAACLSVLPALLEAGRGPRHVLAGVRTNLIRYEDAFPEDTEGRPFLDLDTPEQLERMIQLGVLSS
jgi:molybdopterin-guanine dinucleotide biosynthesis protein A